MIPYIENFYAKSDADDLERLIKTQPHVRKPNPRAMKTGFRRHLNYPGYSIPWGTRRDTMVGKLTLDEMPPLYLELQGRLSAYAGQRADYVNCLGAVGYDGPLDHMNWHQHNDPFVRAQPDQSVWVLSLGEMRLIGIRKLGDEDEANWECFFPRHGSLYVLPHSFNTTHEHIVFPRKHAQGLRLGVNCGHYEVEL
jgi:alkylated DNA repair dioxygenase AlkB